VCVCVCVCVLGGGGGGHLYRLRVLVRSRLRVELNAVFGYTAVPNWLAGATMKRNRLVKMVFLQKIRGQEDGRQGSWQQEGWGQGEEGVCDFVTF
jgi:hypothetical protein